MEKEILLFNSTDEYTIEQICIILKNNDIAFIKKDDGSGAYMKVSMGQNYQDKKIFVSSNDYEKAMELTKKFINDKNTEEIDIDLQKEIIKYQKMKRALGITILGFTLLAIILVSILNN